MGLKFSNYGRNRLVDTFLEVQRACTCGHILQTDIDDGLCEDSSCSSTVTGLFIGLGSDFLDHLRTHVGESVLQFHFLCDSNTVLGNLWCTELLVNDYVTSFRTKCNLYCISKSVNALFHLRAYLNVEFNIFSHNVILLYYNIAIMSD